jgi:hypothetical protein
MRDIVWTLVIVWFIYRFVDMFKSASPKKVAFGEDNNFFDSHTKTHTNTHTHSNKDIKKAVKKSTDKEGEYIDYEEIK